PTDPVAPLREAIRLSPDNLPLRKHLAQSLLDLGRPAEAAVEWRVCLDHKAHDPDAKLGLARTFYALGKKSQALVIAEDLAQGRPLPPSLGIETARLLHRLEQPAPAARLLKTALEAEPDLAADSRTRELCERL